MIEPVQRTATILALTTLLAVRAAAQESPEYQSLLAEAVSEFDAHRFAEARALFRRAHAIEPNARTSRAIGLASFELADYVEAYRSLRAALSDERRPLTDAQRAEVQGVLTRAERFVAVYTVVLDPTDATLDRTLEPDGTLILPLGSHTIVARVEGRGEARQTIEVAGGERTELRFELAAAGGAGAAAVAPVATGSADHTAAIALLIAGGALLAGSIPTIAWWIDRQGAVDYCHQHLCTAGSAVLPTERDAAAAVTIGLLALGAIGVTSGIVAWILSDRPSPSASLSCAPDLLGAQCRGTF